MVMSVSVCVTHPVCMCKRVYVYAVCDVPSHVCVCECVYTLRVYVHSHTCVHCVCVTQCTVSV